MHLVGYLYEVALIYTFIYYKRISSSAPYFLTPSAYVPPSVCETRFHTHKKRQNDIFGQQTGGQKILH